MKLYFTVPNADGLFDISPSALRMYLFLLSESFYKNGNYSPVAITKNELSKKLNISRNTVLKCIKELNIHKLIIYENGCVILDRSKIEHQMLNNCAVDAQKLNTKCSIIARSTVPKGSMEHPLPNPIEHYNILIEQHNIEIACMNNKWLLRIIYFHKEKEFYEMRKKSGREEAKAFDLKNEKLITMIHKLNELAPASDNSEKAISIKNYCIDLMKLAMVEGNNPAAFFISQLQRYLDTGSMIDVSRVYDKDIKPKKGKHYRQACEITKQVDDSIIQFDISQKEVIKTLSLFMMDNESAYNDISSECEKVVLDSLSWMDQTNIKDRSVFKRMHRKAMYDLIKKRGEKII